MSRSIASSSLSVSFTPSVPKNLIPLSAAGLCDAVIITPKWASDSRTARATAGVGKTPSDTGTAPPAYSTGVHRFNQIVAELCERRDEVTPILEQLMSEPMDGVTETTLGMLKSALRERA